MAQVPSHGTPCISAQRITEVSQAWPNPSATLYPLQVVSPYPSKGEALQVTECFNVLLCPSLSSCSKKYP